MSVGTKRATKHAKNKMLTALMTGGAAALITSLLVVAPLGAPVGPAEATTTPAPNCQGTTPLTVGGSWTCSFDDEFNGTSLNTKLWQPQLTANSGYIAGPDCYVNNPSTISESGGYLNLSVVKVPNFNCVDGYYSQYEAGMVTTASLFDQTYGAVEVNAKLPAATTAGLQETFWLWPQTPLYGSSNTGEIDFAEFYSEYPTMDIPYLHYVHSSSDPHVTSYSCFINQAQFNTYEVVWNAQSIKILYNGNVCLTDTPIGGPTPFNQSYFIALTQALGFYGGDNVTASTPFPDTTQVNWVRAWTPAG